MTAFIEKREGLADPVVTAGDRVYLISSQNGLFPDPWGGHVKHEMWGMWNHPVKLFDGFWFALRPQNSAVPRWLGEAEACRVYPTHTEFDYHTEFLRVTRRDFAPDGVEGMVITLTIKGALGLKEPLEVTVFFRSDLRPAWLGERVGMHDAPDTVHFAAESGYLVFKDTKNPWVAIVGAASPPVEFVDGRFAPYQTMGQGISAGLRYSLSLDDHGEARLLLFVSGSVESEAAAKDTFDCLRSAHDQLFKDKKARYQRIVETSQLISPDREVNEAFFWAKVNCQMLAREVPAIGLGVGAGLSEYPWWFGVDSEYAALPMLQAGLFELTEATFRLLKRISLKENISEPGRVVHEVATTGVVFNPGNLVETPLFVRVVHEHWLWTGNRAFLEEMYPFCKQGLLEYTLGQNDPDGDLCPSGRSIIETLEMHAGFECIDPATYTWEALRRLADMAVVMDDAAIIPQLEEKAEVLGRRLREEWWLEHEGLFADVRASVNEVVAALDNIDALARDNPNEKHIQRQAQRAKSMFSPLLAARTEAKVDLDLPWLLRHWVVMCPAEVGLATPEQARKLLTRLESEEFCDEWGMRLHPDNPHSMSINTGLLATAHARYGRMKEALSLMRKLSAALPLHMPGAISEALPNKWCFLQLWSALGIVSPVVQGFLGISPRAGEKHLRIVPKLPEAWDFLHLRKLRVQEGLFDVSVEKALEACRVQVKGTDHAYSLEVGCHLPDGVSVREVTLDGAPVAWQQEKTLMGTAVLCKARGEAQLVIHFALGAGSKV